MRVYPTTPLPNSPPEDIPKVCRVRVPWCWERHTEPKLYRRQLAAASSSFPEAAVKPPWCGANTYAFQPARTPALWLTSVGYGLKSEAHEYRAKARRVQSKSLFHTCCVSMDTAQDRARASVSLSLSAHRTVFRPSQSTR